MQLDAVIWKLGMSVDKVPRRAGRRGGSLLRPGRVETQVADGSAGGLVLATV